MRIIAKGYKNRPFAKLALAKERAAIYLYDESLVGAIGTIAKRAIGFPRDCIFEFESSLFDALCDAYGRQAHHELDILWNRAKPFNAAALPEMRDVK